MVIPFKYRYVIYVKLVLVYDVKISFFHIDIQLNKQHLIKEPVIYPLYVYCTIPSCLYESGDHI